MLPSTVLVPLARVTETFSFALVWLYWPSSSRLARTHAGSRVCGRRFLLALSDQRLPLTQSVDELHRPLRNATLKIAESHLGIQHVWPYRLAVALTFVAVLLLLYRLTRRLGAGRVAALAAVYILAFFPRNDEVLFWFAAWQDLVAAAAVLCACIFFINYRESPNL